MLEYILLFIFGLIVGSFLNVVIYREIEEIEKDKSITKKILSWLPGWAMGRSRCPKCRKDLSWFENIPVLSYLLLRGKCRHCRKGISVKYPLVEIFTALEFVWVYWLLNRLQFFPQLEGIYSLLVLVFWLFVFTLSAALIVIDMKTHVLPDTLVYPGIAIAFLRLFISSRWEFILPALALFGFFLFLYLITQGKGIGFGDVKLSLFIGLVLGWWQWIIVAMFIAFLTGATYGVILIMLKKKTMKSALPFGPFLLGGMIIAKIWGDALWQTYLLSMGM
jgi:prepilin signal peptidase PulO-like enzyme (type II secretory pathway)